MCPRMSPTVVAEASPALLYLPSPSYPMAGEKHNATLPWSGKLRQGVVLGAQELALTNVGCSWPT